MIRKKIGKKIDKKWVTYMNQDEVKRNILSGNQWLRMLFMVGYLLASWVLTLVLLATILVQTVIILITGETNTNLRRFGILCGVFMHQIIHFLVYGSDEKPFPFSEFPDIDRVDTGAGLHSDDSPQYTAHQSSSARSKPATATDTAYYDDPAYDDIAPSTDDVNTDDEFPSGPDDGSDPARRG